MYDILFLFLTYFSPYDTLRRNIVTNSKKTLKRIERERETKHVVHSPLGASRPSNSQVYVCLLLKPQENWLMKVKRRERGPWADHKVWPLPGCWLLPFWCLGAGGGTCDPVTSSREPGYPSASRSVPSELPSTKDALEMLQEEEARHCHCLEP